MDIETYLQPHIRQAGFDKNLVEHLPAFYLLTLASFG